MYNGGERLTMLEPRKTTMSTAPIRTITIGIADAHPIPAAVIVEAAGRLRSASARFAEAGYEVQTLRLSTRPLLDDLVDWSPATLLKYAHELQHVLDEQGIAYCSLGTVQAARLDTPVECIAMMADLLIASTVLSATVQLATVEYGLRAEAAVPIAQVMRRLAHETDEGFGNFRFAMLACVDTGCPFFPSAYHAGPASLALGVQSPSVLLEALQPHAIAVAGKGLDLELVTRVVRKVVVDYATPVVALGQQLAQEYGLQFGGIDLSPAPLGTESITAVMELCGYGPLGSPGTLGVAAALTTALKGTDLPTCGYSGLMLPVLEDAVLGRRWEEGLVNVHNLLLYSAVCGTGLDTIPLPGDTPVETIAHLLIDVATLALRWQKPLSARLFPVPGKHAGERTTFTSPYLTNTVIK
jgi:uncharacterized protein (UPF0210 family)